MTHTKGKHATHRRSAPGFTAILLVAAVAGFAVACGGGGSAAEVTPEAATSTATEAEPSVSPRATAARTPTATATATATATPTLTPTPTAAPTGSGDGGSGGGNTGGGNGGGSNGGSSEWVDDSPVVACSVGAPLSQGTRVDRDCVIGPLVSIEGFALNAGAAAAYESMKTAAAADGIDIYIVSGYRDYDTQMQLYLAEVAAYGADQNTSAKPGHSEHQLGTTVDLNELSPSFGDTPAGQWLQQNAGNFGFQMSYPAGGGTGYAYEPWHWRWWG